MSAINGLMMPTAVRSFTDNAIGHAPASSMGEPIQNIQSAALSHTTNSGAVDEKQLQQALQQLNREASSMNAKVSFRYDRRINQLYVQVVDRDSGEVVREIPPKEFLEHKAAMSEFIGLLLNKKG